ncbi:MAG TPA: glycosyltransferase family 9 protein [Terriglobales bacterium]|nr:glycosyltransferase family 9 protein [Terriglobales bacterium]
MPTELSSLVVAPREENSPVAPTNAATSPASVNRILVVRLSSMGDVIHTMPAVALLRESFPEATLGWIIEERWAELLCMPGGDRFGRPNLAKPLVDAVHVVDTMAWRSAPFSSATWKGMLASWRELHDARYDVAIDFQGAAKTALLARCTGAARYVGFEEPREHAAGVFYTQTAAGRGNHVIEQSVSLAASFAGVAARLPEVEFPIDDAVEEKCERELRDRGVRNFAILNPGAGWGAKQWPAERYGEVAQGLAISGVPSIVNFGPGEEELAKQVEAASGGAARAMPCSVGELIALTRRARLFIGGDTGPMHLAAALHVPVVGIFGPTNPVRNGPFGTRSIVLRNPASETTHARRRQTDPGLLAITSAEVLRAAKELLGIRLA